jgi:hypothetical protein
MQEKMRSFTANIEEKLGNACTDEDFPADSLTPVFDYYYDDDDDGGYMGPAEDELEGSPDDEIPAPEAGDNHVGARVMLPHGGSLARGRGAVRRKRDREGNPSGRANANPVLDTRTYEVEFDGGDVSELTANTIAESMHSMCDEDGNHILIFDEICDFRRSTTALQKDDQLFSDSRGRQQVLKTTKGWQLCVQWKDGSTSWEKLADLK